MTQYFKPVDGVYLKRQLLVIRNGRRLIFIYPDGTRKKFRDAGDDYYKTILSDESIYTKISQEEAARIML